MPIAKLADVDLYYEWAGSESAPVLVLSHSLGAAYHLWDSQLEALGPHFHLLLYDVRGHGASSVPPGPYNVEQLSRDVIHLLDFLHVPRAHFCGISMGGTTGMYLGAHHAERFTKLILADTAPKIGNDELWNTRIAKIRAGGGMMAVSNALIERWFTFDFRSSHPEEVEEIQHLLETTDPEGYIACCAAVRDADLRPSLPNIKLPTLAIGGTHDIGITPADTRLISDSVPGAKYVELNASHISNVEARDAFNREVLAFLQS